MAMCDTYWSFTCIEVLGFRQLAHQALEGDRYMRSAYLM